MATRTLASTCRRIFNSNTGNGRYFSTINIIKDNEKGYSILEMARKPHNSISLAMLEEISQAIHELESDKAMKGFVLASSCPKFFTIGLDLKELYNPDPARLGRVAGAFQELWGHIFGTPLATVAAINGNSPAAGCIFSIACDYRVMADGKHAIGLNETQLGITPAGWVFDSLKHVLGPLEAERHLARGALLSPQEALAVRLVDEVVPEENLLATAQQRLIQQISVPDKTRRNIKEIWRKPAVERMHATREQNVQFFVKQLTSQLTQQRLKFIIDRQSPPNKTTAV